MFIGLLNKVKTHLLKLSLENIVVRMITAYCFVSSVLIFVYHEPIEGLIFLKTVNYAFVIFMLAIVFFVLNLFGIIIKKRIIDKILLFISVISYFSFTVSKIENMYYTIGVLVLVAILIFYSLKDIKGEGSLEPIFTKSVYVFLGVIFFVFVGGLTALRYMTFSAPCFDFGIWAQMFHNMRLTGLPITTCERYMELSHFAVHISPIYYLILPFYMIFPYPITLQLSQALIIASAFIPLYLLGRHFKLPDYIMIFVGICFMFYPALSSGCFYDLHENCFLVPLILWLFYFIEKNKAWGIVLFALLICLVKEDAPVYVAFIALYMILGKKMIAKGSIVLALSLLYFFFALTALEFFGEGAMFGRYSNYAVEGNDLIGVFKAVLANPAYIISQSMTEKKIVFILQMLLPLAFVPLINKKFSSYILIGPFVLINLMSNYTYQYSISYQYIFGTSAIFFYLLISNISTMKPDFRRMLVVFCAVSSAFVFLTTTFHRVSYIEKYFDNKDDYRIISTSLDTIPSDASVCSSTMFVAHLYDRPELYSLNVDFYDDDYSNNKNETNGENGDFSEETELDSENKSNKKVKYRDVEYIALDLRYSHQRILIFDFVDIGYELIDFHENLIAIFKNPYYEQ